MRYVYKDERTRDLFEDDRKFRARYGLPSLKKRDLRLGELAAFETVAELLALGSSGMGRWHVLDGRDGGSRKGMISGDLAGKYRLLLSPVSTDYGTTVVVEVAGVDDTH